MKKLAVFVALTSVILSGCTIKDMAAVGGSKSDGTVQMAFEHGAFDIIDIDKTKALNSATKRCQAWGYKSAEAFDDGIRSCVNPALFGDCNRFRTVVTYQCLDDK